MGDRVMPDTVLRSRAYVLVAAVALALSASCGSSSGSGSMPTATAIQPTATPSPTPLPPHRVGDLVTVDNLWQIKITAVKVLGPSDSSNLHLVGLDMTLRNLGAQPARLDDGYFVTLRDGSGSPHAVGEQSGICQLTTGEKTCLDNLFLNPGAEGSGDLGAVVPVDQTQFTLAIVRTSGQGTAGAVIWSMSLS
jgi:hypothetical protein